MAAASASPPIHALHSDHKVFVYGSLLADEVVCVLLKRVPPSAPALLPNYHRYSIKDRAYPAIVPVEKKQVIGRVLFGITDLELHIFDIFEDVEYERHIVEVSMLESSETMQAHAYVWGNKTDPDLYGDWDFEEWRKKQLEDFLGITNTFMVEIEQPEAKSR